MQSKTIKTGAVAIIACIAIVAGFMFMRDSGQDGSEVIGTEAQPFTVYKSPTCGCCVNYVAKLRREGVEVEVVEREDMSPIKERYNIPRSMQSCHTTVIGDYFVEGHVPFEAISLLMEQKPDIDGIALPGMPAGSPGMPGIKSAPFDIYGLKGGNANVFTQI